MNWELLEYLKAFNAVFFSKTSKLVGFILCLKSLYRSMQVWLVTSVSETLSCPSVFYCRICPNVNWLWSRESKIGGCQNFTLFTVLVGTCFLLKKRGSVFARRPSSLCVCQSEAWACASLSKAVILHQGQRCGSVPSKHGGWGSLDCWEFRVVCLICSCSFSRIKLQIFLAHAEVSMWFIMIVNHLGGVFLGLWLLIIYLSCRKVCTVSHWFGQLLKQHNLLVKESVLLMFKKCLGGSVIGPFFPFSWKAVEIGF